MRTYLITAIMLIGTNGAAAAGAPQSEFERSYRESFRKSSIEACVSTGPKAGPAATQFQSLCTCVTDRLLATKTVEQLSQKPSDDEVRALVAGCAASRPNPS